MEQLGHAWLRIFFSRPFRGFIPTPMFGFPPKVFNADQMRHRGIGERAACR
jgi:hypothetical protein